MSPSDSNPLLDAALLAQLSTLQLDTNHRIAGALVGRHRSPKHGSSIEFAEHKEYTQGDDIRHLDWKAYAKLDRYYVKRFEDETNLRTFILLDTSGSMRYGEGDQEKFRHGCRLAAALAFLLLLLVLLHLDERALLFAHCMCCLFVYAVSLFVCLLAWLAGWLVS